MAGSNVLGMVTLIEALKKRRQFDESLTENIAKALEVAGVSVDAKSINQDVKERINSYMIHYLIEKYALDKNDNSDE